MTFANTILNVDDFDFISGGGSIALLSIVRGRYREGSGAKDPSLSNQDVVVVS